MRSGNETKASAPIRTAIGPAISMNRRPHSDGYISASPMASARKVQTSATATPASSQMHRNQNGSSRAFQSRLWGAVMKAPALSTVMIVRKIPVRCRWMIEARPPTAASTATQMRLVGNSVLPYLVIFSQPMSVVYGIRIRNGRIQNAASAPAVTGTGTAHPRQSPEDEGGDRQSQHAQHGHQLEGDPVREDRAEDDDEQAGQREVEDQGWEAGVPVGRPAGQAGVREQVVAQVGRLP